MRDFIYALIFSLKPCLGNNVTEVLSPFFPQSEVQSAQDSQALQ